MKKKKPTIDAKRLWEWVIIQAFNDLTFKNKKIVDDAVRFFEDKSGALKDICDFLDMDIEEVYQQYKERLDGKFTHKKLRFRN